MSKTPLTATAVALACLGVQSPAVAGSCSDSQATTASAKTKKTGSDIVEVARANGSFTTLLAAVEAAGLVETLKGEGPFTVFAPNDAAFAKLPAGTVEALLADTPKLSVILTYHVVGGKVMAGDIVKAKGATPTTVNGSPLAVVVRDGKVYVNGEDITVSTAGGKVTLTDAQGNTSTVVKTDVAASNGVIHVIDTVLQP